MDYDVIQEPAYLPRINRAVASLPASCISARCQLPPVASGGCSLPCVSPDTCCVTSCFFPSPGSGGQHWALRDHSASGQAATKNQPAGGAKAETLTRTFCLFFFIIEMPGRWMSPGTPFSTYRLYCSCSESVEESAVIYTTPVIRFPLLLSNLGWKLGPKVREMLSVSWSE